MERKIESKLMNWKNKRFQALLVKGARQIGKRYSIEHFLAKEFASYKEVNFANYASALEAFAFLKGYDDFESKLSLLFGDVIDEPNVAIFFDEIQLIYRRRREEKEKNPKALDGTVDLVTLIKNVVQKDKRRYILSGSLLGVTLEGVLLDPAGYMDVIKMYPMDFEEFLWAKGFSKQIIKKLRDSFKTRTVIDDTIHQKLLYLFREYVMIGGMPEALEHYLKDNNFYNATLSQEQIIGYYHKDIVTYSRINERLEIQEIYDAIPSEIDSKNKRFKKINLDLPNAKNLDLADRFLWLTKAGVALPVYNTTDLSRPLTISEQRKTLKLFMSDVGLLSSLLLGDDGRKKMLSGDIILNYGAPFENVVAQELTAHGFAPLHYWNSKKSGEIDFVISKDGESLPIEIKSGKSGPDCAYNHRALDHSISVNESIRQAYVFSEENIFKESDIITNFPIYLIAFLENDKPNPFEE